jgi:photosystem II stability/assembly factor-like uncharacterized protein
MMGRSFGQRGRLSKQIGTSKRDLATTDTDSAETGSGVSIFGRRLALTSTVGVLMVVVAVALATTIGAVVIHTAASSTSPGSSHSLTAAAPPTTTTTTTTVPAALVNGPSQTKAPAFPISGGQQKGYGNFNALTCATTTICVAVGADDQGNGVASTSSDGGTTWSKVAMPVGTPVLDAVACGDSAHCVAVGQGAVAVTADQGSSWSLHPLPTANTTLIGADCPSTSVCVAAGIAENVTGPYVGTVERSSDGGDTWQAASVPTGTKGIGGVVCPSITDCIAVGDSLLVSHDGGATWATTTAPDGISQLRTVSCSSTTMCGAIGPNPQGVFNPNVPADAIETTDGGSTWTNLTLPAATGSLAQISCSAIECLAGGLSATAGGAAPLYQSSDGGSTWKPAPQAPSGLAAIVGLSCPAANQCAIVGRASDGTATTSASGDLSTWITAPTPGGFTRPSASAVS